METASSKTRILLALSHLEGITSIALKEVSELDDFENLSFGDFQSESPEIKEAYEKTGILWDTLLDYADDQIEIAKEHNIRIISILDDDYPKLLLRAIDDPNILYVKGDISHINNKPISIIGTREPTEHAEIITKRLTQFFSTNGCTIISGFYHGIDTVSLNEALENKANIVALLPNSFDCILPVHLDLADKVLANGGAIVSQFPFKTQLKTDSQIQCDRLQAGLSSLMFLIQSAVNGVGLNAARFIIENGRFLVVTQPTQKDRETERLKNAANEIFFSKNYERIIEILNIDKRFLNESLRQIVCIQSNKDFPIILKIIDKIS